MRSTAESKGTYRFLFYSHDGLGLGHIRRNLALATALLEQSPESSVLLATGSDEVTHMGLLPNIEALKLPGVRKVDNGHYVSRRLDISRADIFGMRSALLKAAVMSFRPDVMLVDKHPLGAHGELRTALDWHRSRGGATLLGLRDILDEPSTVLREWQHHDLTRQMQDYYDGILIYGDPKVFDPIVAYDFSPVLARRTRFCGYVANSTECEPFAAETPPELMPCIGRRPVVLATPGGGEDGHAMLHAFLESAAQSDWESLVVTGPMAPEAELRSLQGRARELGIPLRTFVPGISSWFALVDAVVCMGGYNTLVETVSRGTPVVCIPRCFPRTEQLIRARAFARLGLLQMLEPQEVCPQGIREAVSRALSYSRKKLLDRARATLDFDGACRASACLLKLAGRRRVLGHLKVEYRTAPAYAIRA